LVSLANSWIETELIYAEAQRRGVTNDPQAIFLADMHSKMAVGQVLRAQVQAEATVSDEEVRTYYEQGKDTDRRLQKPGRLSFTHIRTRTIEDAQKVLERLKAGEDIIELAKELSIHSDSSGGGTVVESQYRRVERNFGDDFFDALSGAEQGQLVGPIELEDNLGFEIGRKDGDVKPEPVPFEKVKDRLRQQLVRTKGRKAYSDLVSSLMAQAGAKIVKSQRLVDAEKAARETPQRRGPRGPRTPGAASRSRMIRVPPEH
jgi:parvulin-like peptidyl-prolyl isomerase